MTIVDTGFLFGLLDKSDRWHKRCLALSDTCRESWITTWPVVTETSQLALSWLGSAHAAALLQEFADEQIKLWEIPLAAQRQLPALMRRYANLPMDLADASLVLLADHLGHGRIATTDERDFGTYRWKARQPFDNLLG
jgi:predicted nucleic acid-binding protein